MKKNSFILKIVIAAMILVTAALGANKAGFFEKRIVSQDTAQVQPSQPEAQEGTDAVSPTDPAGQTTVLSPEERVTYDLGESCETDDWQYTIASVRVTKSGEGMIPFPEGYYTEDENGDLICDSSFIVADMEITNNSASDRPLYLNSTRVDLYNYTEKNVFDSEGSVEACAYTFNGEKSIYAKDFFACDFKAGETKSFRVGYIVHDEDISRDFDIIRIEINHSGAAGFNSDIRYYRIGENTNLKGLENE